MLAAASYPDPFENAGTTCALTCILTQGPCRAPSAPLRRDISEGEPGIPLRSMLRVLDADGCTPVSGAEVEIWYCNVDGLYSAEDVENPGFCTGDDEHALESYFFRGRAIADAAGKVTFEGCFPGWYPSRSIHIHVLVRHQQHRQLRRERRGRPWRRCSARGAPRLKRSPPRRSSRMRASEARANLARASSSPGDLPAAHSGVPASTHCSMSAKSSALTQPSSPGSPPSQPWLPEPDSGIPPDSISSTISSASRTASS